MPYAPTIREEELKNKVVCRGQGQCGSSSALMCWWRGNGAALRAFAFTCVAAATIYGGGKGKGGYGESEVQPERGQPVRDGGASLAGSSGGFVSNLCFTAIGIDSDDVVTLTAAWPDGTLDLPATFDFFVKTNLADKSWNWLFAQSALSGTSNLSASIALSNIGDWTNAPSSAFFTFRHREADCQTMFDYDGDGIPDIYELRNGTNPYLADAELAPRLTVGTGGSHANIQDALAASTNYSIISLAPETFKSHSPIELPAHPVMVVAEGGRATVESDAVTGAFVIDKGNNEQTLLRGLNIVLAARANFQAAFWCGGNVPWNGLAATPTFEDIRIRAPYPEPLYYGWHFFRQADASATIRNCTVNAAGASAIHGIYSYDGPKLAIENCTFANFPADHAGVFLQATQGQVSVTTNVPAVNIVGCAFDDSFTKAYPIARLSGAAVAANYLVSMSDCIIPADLEAPHIPDMAENVSVTNAGTLWNGIARPCGAATAFNVGNPNPDDFDVSMDSDNDGLSDYDEAFVYETDPWLADSDGDGLLDADIPETVSSAKILPAGYAQKLPLVRGLPILSFDQEEKALVNEVSSIGASVLISRPPEESQRSLFSERIVEFDSSNPNFLIIGDAPVLLFSFFGATVGPSVAFWKDEIQNVMDQLMPGYCLSEADFSEYDSKRGDGGHDE